MISFGNKCMEFYKCSNCGKEGFIINQCDQFSLTLRYKVLCKCGKETEFCPTMEQAIDEWNLLNKPEEEQIKNLIIGGYYQHFKGGEYQVKEVGIDTQTDERVVIYQDCEDKMIYTRPLMQWFEPKINDSGETVDRFTFIGVDKVEVKE